MIEKTLEGTKAVCSKCGKALWCIHVFDLAKASAWFERWDSNNHNGWTLNPEVCKVCQTTKGAKP